MKAKEKPDVYPINFGCDDCAGDGYCMAYDHPCSSIDCTEKIRKEEKIMSENKTDSKELIKLWANVAKRKAFLEAYKDWGVWLETPELELKYYRYRMPDKTLIIAMEHRHRSYNPKTHKYEIGEENGVFYYVQKLDEPIFSPEFRKSISEVADILKWAKMAMQKKGEAKEELQNVL